MHAAERQDLIIELLRERGFIGFRELDHLLDASPATIRRDLERMAESGQVERVHGGARLAVPAVPPMARSGLTGVPFHENVALYAAEKIVIGRAAAALCAPGDAVIIDGGSTTLQMCPHLEELELQVLTNSLHIVSALLGQRGTRISVPSGTIFREQNIILSPFEDDGAGRFHATRMFMGGAAINRHGLLQADTLLVQAERRLMERADEIVALVDHSKFKGSAGHLVCGLADIGVVITDTSTREEDIVTVRAAGCRVIIAS